MYAQVLLQLLLFACLILLLHKESLEAAVDRAGAGFGDETVGLCFDLAIKGAPPPDVVHDDEDQAEPGQTAKGDDDKHGRAGRASAVVAVGVVQRWAGQRAGGLRRAVGAKGAHHRRARALVGAVGAHRAGHTGARIDGTHGVRVVGRAAAGAVLGTSPIRICTLIIKFLFNYNIFFLQCVPAGQISQTMPP